MLTLKQKATLLAPQLMPMLRELCFNSAKPLFSDGYSNGYSYRYSYGDWERRENEMTKFDYFESNGHHLVVLNGRNFIIDTGSPLSFVFGKESEALTVDGRVITLQGAGNGIALTSVKKKDVDKLVGCDVAGFIGMDWLTETGLTLNREQHYALFGVEHGENAERLRLEAGLGNFYCVLRGLTLNGKPVSTTLLDTGAWLGYAKSELLDDAEECGRYEDYNPSLGHLRGTKYSVSVQAGKRLTQMEAAKMSGVLSVLGALCDACIGIGSLFEKSICFDLRNGWLYLE